MPDLVGGINLTIYVALVDAFRSGKHWTKCHPNLVLIRRTGSAILVRYLAGCGCLASAKIAL